ncbi:hypothetical protein BDV97DRAFT_365718 [Delphinella strobiligena]|nr:hypothetical protein BDV97DRAFT_365718 [Delphinella strobiligena]
MTKKRSRLHDENTPIENSAVFPRKSSKTSSPAVTSDIGVSTKTAHQQSQSSFFRLPWELRSLIYRTALSKEQPLEDFFDLAHDDSLDAEPPLLLTCRRARQEALPLFYGHNDWVVKTRRVNNRRDPETRKPVLYEIIPKWVEQLDAGKIWMLGTLVVVGTRGSFVDVEGMWREGKRAAFRLRQIKRRPGYSVEEVALDGDDTVHEVLPEAFCGVQLVDLLRARMRCFGKIGGGGAWGWKKEDVHDLACLL